jgi:UDP-2-acetamido-2-deoxy-ribo-hexuluronate aminotransferase
MLQAGVPTAVHYPKPLHHQPAYAGGQDPMSCPRSTEASARVLSLPMSADLDSGDQERVVAELAKACARVMT